MGSVTLHILWLSCWGLWECPRDTFSLGGLWGSQDFQDQEKHPGSASQEGPCHLTESLTLRSLFFHLGHL